MNKNLPHKRIGNYSSSKVAIKNNVFKTFCRDFIVCFGDSITNGDGSIDKESYPAYLKKLLSE